MKKIISILELKSFVWYVRRLIELKCVFVCGWCQVLIIRLQKVNQNEWKYDECFKWKYDALGDSLCVCVWLELTSSEKNCSIMS